MADLSSILGGMIQGFKDFGTGVVDLFGTGGAAIGDLIQTGGTSTKNQDDFRKWLYQTDNTQDAAAKGLGTILNGVQTVADVIPGAQAVTANPLFNGLQGAVAGVSDELKMAGKDVDWGRAAQRAGVGGTSSLLSAGVGQKMQKSGNKLLSNGLTRGAVQGAIGGSIANAGYTGIEGGSVQDMINAGLYGAQTGALVGGTTGLARELIKPTYKTDMALTDGEKAARIANIDDQLGKLDLNTPEGNARYNELMQARQQYSGNKRLYRGLSQEYDPNYPKNRLDTQGYESWTDNPELARQYGENVYYIDVPEGDIKTSYLDENPMSETYGDRNPIYSIDKKAGLNGVSGNEYLLSVDDPYKEGLAYNRLGGKPKTVADLMNEPKQKTVADPAQPDYLGDEKYSKLVEKAKNYKTLDRFEKMNNPIKGSEIWGEKPKSYFERDSRAVRINMFPNDAAKGTGLTKQYLLNMFKDAYDDGITDIVPSYGSYTKEGASFMNHLADQGWVKQNGRNGYNSYEITPKIAEWKKTSPLADIYNAANNLGGKPKTVADLMLSPEQEEFFKDSKVRDENGSLKKMYHGSNSKFTVFDKSKGGQSNKSAKVGHWFTPSKEGAEKWATQAWWGDNDPSVYETYLDIKKPMIYESVDNSAQINKLKTQLKQAENRLDSTYKGSQEYYDAYKEYNNIANEIDNLSYTDPYEQFRSHIYAMEGKTPSQANVGGTGMAMNDEDAAVQKYVDMLKSEGYDGIIIKGTGYDQRVMGGPNDQYVVFDSNQIKSVDNLNPTSVDDINYSKEPTNIAELMYSKAKPAEGQLSIFDQPKQKPTNNDQLDLFSQPKQKPVEAENPYAPIDGKVTDKMRARAEMLTKNPDIVPDNELYSKIDKETLPKTGIDVIANEADGMSQKAKREYITKKYLGVDNADNLTLEEAAEAYYDMFPNEKQDFARQVKRVMDNPWYEDSTKNRILENSRQKLVKRIKTRINKAADSTTKRGGYTGAADTALSERLGIAPGNTNKRTAAYDDKDTAGRYRTGAREIAVKENKLDPENAISTMAHERLHSFQAESKPEVLGRYSDEVKQAYNDLSKELKQFRHTQREVSSRYGYKTKYWYTPDEQEARMFQQYLQNKGYTDAPQVKTGARANEWGNEINPAFDKFIDKLRDMSKRGVALPAITALFGGGAIMASQNNGKKKKSEVK